MSARMIRDSSPGNDPLGDLDPYFRKHVVEAVEVELVKRLEELEGRQMSSEEMSTYGGVQIDMTPRMTELMSQNKQQDEVIIYRERILWKSKPILHMAIHWSPDKNKYRLEIV